ncbi:MAG: hypothetical protein M1834_001734 [Cirrosporium novae-zelandiae]|nr:MAG: hypothetical protein M1834_001734 [Cirrosporium novae-zelandiae]
MSVFSLDILAGNPVRVQDVDEACAFLGVTLKEEEKGDYLNLLAVYHASTEKLLAMNDYVPEVDEERFPRENIYYPETKDNPYNAWAWRFTLKDKNSDGKGILEGKTFALKDCIGVKGVPMMFGTDFFKDYTPNVDAVIVTRILEAGGIITGRATCENMCHSATSFSAATGPVHNPYAKGYSSGGSSSGSAVLVALGDVDGAIGADQGGSIRVPAGWCGIFGLKPTFGLVPFTGIASNEATNDHVGPMTKTLLDNALLLQAIAGTDGIDDRSFGSPTPEGIPKYYDLLNAIPNPKDLSGMRIGILGESIKMPSLDPRIKACFLTSAEKFKELGAEVDYVSVPLHSEGAIIWTGISKYSGFLSKTGATGGRRGYFMNDFLSKTIPLTQEKWDNAYPRFVALFYGQLCTNQKWFSNHDFSVKNTFLNGAYAWKHFPTLLGKAANLSLALRKAYDAALSKYDVLVLPNLPYIANSHPSPDATPLQHIAKQVGLTSNTAPFNQSGHPVLAMPIGKLEIIEGPLKGSGTKLPVSMQVVGKWYGEETVYKAAYAWSEAFDWTSM